MPLPPNQEKQSKEWRMSIKDLSCLIRNSSYHCCDLLKRQTTICKTFILLIYMFLIHVHVYYLLSANHHSGAKAKAMKVNVLYVQSNLPIWSTILNGHLFLYCHRKCHMNWTSFKRSPVLEDHFFLCTKGDLIIQVWQYM